MVPAACRYEQAITRADERAPATGTGEGGMGDEVWGLDIDGANLQIKRQN